MNKIARDDCNQVDSQVWCKTHSIGRSASKLRLGSSSIHGIGVFAGVLINASQVVFATAEFDVLPKAVLGTVARAHDENVLERGVLRWINHACYPNAKVRFCRGLVLIVAAREIGAGDEVVCDYLHTESSIPLPFRCNCSVCESRLIAGRVA